ncbi:MAG: XRE family transcriptional regulator [Spirochaetales bacterium]|nr:XRE family transcriptional regulator [Spirochaetales bacterium]
MHERKFPYDFSILRSLRKRAGLTITKLSEASGVSPSVISKLERNQNTAEVETLFRIARCFGMSAADLLSLAEPRTAHRKKTNKRQSHGFAFEEVAYSNIRCMEATAMSGEHLSRPEVHEDDYELCWVKSGTVTISLPGEHHTLHEGESLQFDAMLEHAYTVVENCQILILHIPKPKRF